MQQSGWVIADKLTFKNGLKVVFAIIFRKSYTSAPVNNAYLFGNLQTFSYQQETNGKVDTRHHVRFWRVPDGWIMPGGYKVDWVASGTYDKAIGISYFTFQIAHKIASETDIERDYIIETLNKHAKPKKVRIIKNYSSAYHHRSSGGDMIITDGSLPIIEL
jgi:hypothetical protein